MRKKKNLNKFTECYICGRDILKEEVYADICLMVEDQKVTSLSMICLRCAAKGGVAASELDAMDWLFSCIIAAVHKLSKQRKEKS